MENLAFINSHLESLVASDALYAKDKVSEGGIGKGLFLDCGSNLGQGFTFFRKYYPLELFDFTLIEPNPNCLPHLENLRSSLPGHIEIINMAASIDSGEASFFGLTESRVDNTAQGGSIIEDHNNMFYKASEADALKVKTFSLAELIKIKSAEYNTIILKLDIESGEYDVLEDLIKNKAHLAIDYSYVEFHSQYMAEPKCSHFRAREVSILEKYKKDCVPLRVWV
jgi:FkbM family methyltransferase